MEIKNYNPRELNDLIKIFINVYNGPPWNDQWKKERAEIYLKSFIADPLFIGYSAYHNKQLIGACFGVKKYWWKGDEYYIHEIFIDNTFQRQGIGSTFLDQIQKELELKEIRTITLFTNKGTPADCFYKANGFKDIEIMTFKYKNL